MYTVTHETYIFQYDSEPKYLELPYESVHFDPTPVQKGYKVPKKIKELAREMKVFLLLRGVFFEEKSFEGKSMK